MNKTFPVKWQRIFKSVAVESSVGTIIVLILAMGIRLLRVGFDYNEALISLLLLVCAPVILTGFSFLITFGFTFATITISNEEICGLNFWGFKNRIPLTDISKLTPYSSSGLNVIIVHSHYHGKIFIWEQTQRLPELLKILAPHLPESERKTNDDYGVGRFW